MKWVLVIVSCPCHLVILTAVLAGTTAGALLARHMPMATVLMTAVFAGSLMWAGRDVRRSARSGAANAEAGACCAGTERR